MKKRKQGTPTARKRAAAMQKVLANRRVNSTRHSTQGPENRRPEMEER